jgi:hypothetical protein
MLTHARSWSQSIALKTTVTEQPNQAVDKAEFKQHFSSHHERRGV